MGALLVTGRLRVVYSMRPDAGRHVLNIAADNHAIDIEVGSLADLLAFRRALPGLHAVRREMESSVQALNVSVGGIPVARRRPGHAPGPIERWLGVDPLEIVWAGFVRALFLPRG
jgi:hypothetical protein